MTGPTAPGWYYALNGERVGPRSLDEVRALVSTGVLDADALVWTAGMRDWARVADVNILDPGWDPRPVVDPRPEPAPEPRASEVEDDAPQPWRRFGARFVDTVAFMFALTFLLALVSPALIEQMAREPMRRNPALGFALFVALIPIEGAVMALTGTTPGKALFGIRVTTREGDRLSFGQSLERAVRVMVLGMAVGITPLNLLTWILSFMRLRSRGRTLWDETMDLRIRHEPITPLSAMTIGGIVLLFFMLMGAAFAGAGAP